MKQFFLNRAGILFILSGLLFVATFIVSINSDECACGFSRDLFFFDRENRITFFSTVLAIIFLSAGILFTKITRYQKVVYTTVIVIISAFFLLSSLNTGHEKCPDTRKIANIKSVQLELEIFKDKYGAYPDKLEELINKFEEVFTGPYYHKKALTEHIESTNSYKKTEDGYRLTAKLICSKNNYKIQGDIDPAPDFYEVKP